MRSSRLLGPLGLTLCAALLASIPLAALPAGAQVLAGPSGIGCSDAVTGALTLVAGDGFTCTLTYPGTVPSFVTITNPGGEGAATYALSPAAQSLVPGGASGFICGSVVSQPCTSLSFSGQALSPGLLSFQVVSTPLGSAMPYSTLVVTAGTVAAGSVVTGTASPTSGGVNTVSPTGTISFDPASGSANVGDTVQVSLYLAGNGQPFTAASATVSIPNNNLTVLNILPGTCGLSFSTAPSPADPSFAGGVAGGTQGPCSVYTLVLYVNGNRANLLGQVSITNGQLLTPAGTNVLASTMDAVYSLS